MQLTLDVTPTLVRSAGVKNLIFYWSQALEAAKGGNSIRYYPFLDRLVELHHDKGLEGGIPNWRLFVVAGMNFPVTHSVTRWMVPRAEVFHGSPQTRKRPRTARLTSHIHDMTCWLMPEMHTRANVNAAAQMAEQVWRPADGLIAISNSARDDAERILGLDPRKIEVIYCGIPDAYFAVSAEETERVRAKYLLAKPYCFSVGTVEPRKNFDRLLDAWNGLGADIREEFDLVIAGPAGWKSEETLGRLRAPDAKVRYFGYVDEADLPGLTAGAAALLYPSLYEGFGLPLAQAMACGVPSVTSHVASLPEVAAGSALLVDPLSTDSIREGILHLLTSPTLRAELGCIGKQRALEKYRWEAAARQSWAFFERIVG